MLDARPRERAHTPGAWLAGVALCLLAGAPAYAQSRGGMAQSRGAMAQASAEIQRPVSLGKPSDLAFGALIPARSAGRVVLGPDGARSATGGVLLAAGASGVSTANVQIAGEPHATFSLSLPASIQIASGRDRMTVGAFTTGRAAQQLDGQGALVLNVGATLELGPNQSAGLYTGTFTMTVAYN